MPQIETKLQSQQHQKIFQQHQFRIDLIQDVNVNLMIVGRVE